MKRFTIILSIFIAGAALQAQHSHTWKRYSLFFDAPFQLEEYQTESIDVFGSDNDNYAVDISGYPISQYTSWYGTSSMKSVASAAAEAYGFTETGEGGTIPGIKDGYYLVTESRDDNGNVSAIVVMVVAKSEKLKYYIEGTIYCYNKDRSNGIKIAKTFKFLE